MYQSKKRPSFDQKDVVTQKTAKVSNEKETISPMPPPQMTRPPIPPPPPPIPESRPTPPPPRPAPPPPPPQAPQNNAPPIILPPHQRWWRAQTGAHFAPASPPPRPTPSTAPHFRRRGQAFSSVETSVFPFTEGDADNSRAEFERENPKSGILRVETFLGGRALPVDGVNIVITHRIGDDDVVYYNVNTNEVGIVDGLTLPAPDASTSQSPNEPNPFATYDLYATRDSYLPIGPIEIQIFDGIKTIQPLLMQWRLGGD